MEDINKNISEKRETPKFSYEVRNNGDVIFIKGGNEDQLFELAWQIFKKLDGSKFFHPSIKDGLKNGEDTRPQYGIYGIKFRKDHIYYRELLGLVSKTTGLGGSIIKNKAKLGRIKFAFLSHRFLKGIPSGQDDVDLLIVGSIVLPELQVLIADEQAKREVEINYSFMDEAEFKFRVKRRDPFILRVLTQPKVMLLGDEEEMLEGVIA